MLLFFLICLNASAVEKPGLFLPSIIGDRMILQQQTEAAIWGWDRPGTTVVVSFRGVQVSTQAQTEGLWRVRVPTGTAGGPFVLKIEGSEVVTLKEVAVGEVWVAGGQSNMWWPVSHCLDRDRAIQAANYPDVRIWDANAGRRGGGWKADQPQRTVQTEWKVTNSQTVGDFPGTAYFFARELHETLKVPVGIVHLAVAGEEIETFLSRGFMEVNFPEWIEVWESRKKLYPSALKEYQADLRKWREEKARSLGLGIPKPPPAPINPQEVAMPGAYFNGTIFPAVPYSLRGFIWWQGESNAKRWLQYRILFPSLIEEWRQLWQQNDAPFLFVELANFLTKQQQPSEDDLWPALRDAQGEALRLPKTFRVSAIDILGETEDVSNIHPLHKQLAGHRLFLAAMVNVYGDRSRVASGPVYQGVEFLGNQVRVTFDGVGSGLTVLGGGELKGFALAGRDRKFFWAKGEIQGNTVILTSEAVPQPIAVRYAWANNPIGNLYNRDGLPAFPFRTDRWILRPKREDLN